MDAVAAPAVGSELTASTNPLALFNSDGSAHILRRYQPSVVVTLAVAVGVVWDRYGPVHVFIRGAPFARRRFLVRGLVVCLCVLPSGMVIGASQSA